MSRIFYVLLTFSLLGPTVAQAQDDQCRTFFQAKQFSDAFKSCMPLAERGDGEASFIISSLYTQGGVDGPASLGKAITWLTRSAEQGYGPGCYNLAVLYERGEVVEHNDSTAFKWFLRGSELDYVPSQLKTGIAYLKGVGVERNVNQAGRWLGHAAAAGDQSAQVTLAALLTGIEPQKSVELFHMAAAQRNSYAHYQLALIYSEAKLEQVKNLEKALMHAKESQSLGYAPASVLVDRLKQQITLQKSDVNQVAVLSQPEHKIEMQDDAIPHTEKEATAADAIAIKVTTQDSPEASSDQLNLQHNNAAVGDLDLPLTANGLRDMEWLQSQPSGRYVLQLVQLAKISSVERFLKDNKLEGQANYFRTQTGVGKVYVVLYADSAISAADAKKLAQQRLSPSIAKQVWFRSYRAVQSAYHSVD